MGVNPLNVQRVIGFEVIRFLDALTTETSIQDSAHHMDANGTTRWHRLGRPRALQLVDQ